MAGGFPRARLRTIVPGIDGAAFTARVKREPAALRCELGVEADEVLVLMVGNLRLASIDENEPASSFVGC